MSKKNFLTLLFCIIVGGVMSLLTGQDVCFDLQNYHLYTPYAFLTGRLETDIIPAGALHTFFNPLLDIPFFIIFYYLNEWPLLTGFLQGVYFGLFLFILWKLLLLLLGKETKEEKALCLATLLLAATGMASLFQIGHTSNETQIAIFSLLSCYLLFKGTDSDLRFKPSYLAGAALIAGAMTGLKYTAGPNMVGIGCACLFLLIKNKSSWKHYLYIAGAALAGLLLTDGYFLLKKWIFLGNPLFPFFNDIFKSPFFDPISLPNGPHTPVGWKEWLFLPFLRYKFFILEYRLDVRLIIGWIAFVLLFIRQIILLFKKVKFSKAYTLPLCIFLGTYVSWVIMFGNMRYSIFLEVLSCLLFVLVFRCFLSARWSILPVILALIGLLMHPLPEWQRRPFRQTNIFFSTPISVPDDAFVVLGGHISFLVPYLNPKARYGGGVTFFPWKFQDAPYLTVRKLSPLQLNDYRHHFDRRLREAVLAHKGPIYLITPNPYWIWNSSFWAWYGINISDRQCTNFTTSLTPQYKSLALCKVKKIPQP